MSYAQSVLQPGEKIRATGRLHWIVYAVPAFMALVGLKLWVTPTYDGIGLLFLLIGALLSVRQFFRALITEIAVTDRRVIYKTGFIGRRTVEMNMRQIETVDVNQSIFGRLLGYGTIHLRGSGSSIENLRQITSPLALRKAITAA